MSENDLYLSNGTCFFGAGQIANTSFIPCGNSALSGVQSCCYEGDYCLGQGACWDAETIVVYVAGCTDSSFTSSKCIDRRHYNDQQWVAMARCDGDDMDLWTGCDHHPEKIEIEKENCDCNKSEILVKNSEKVSTLDQIASLPPTAGGPISFNPTALPTREADETSSEGAIPTAAGSSESASGELSTGAKAGIGVGVGVGGLLIILIIVLAFMMRRKKQREAAAKESEAAAAAAAIPPHQPETAQVMQQQQSPHHIDPSQPGGGAAAYPGDWQSISPALGGVAAPAYSEGYYHKPELSADSTYKPELAGDMHGGAQEAPGGERRPHSELQG